MPPSSARELPQSSALRRTQAWFSSWILHKWPDTLQVAALSYLKLPWWYWVFMLWEWRYLEVCKALERKLPLNACGCQATLPFGESSPNRAFAPAGPRHMAGAPAEGSEGPGRTRGGFGWAENILQTIFLGVVEARCTCKMLDLFLNHLELQFWFSVKLPSLPGLDIPHGPLSPLGLWNKPSFRSVYLVCNLKEHMNTHQANKWIYSPFGFLE